MSYTEEVEATAEDYFDTRYQLLKSKLKTIYFFHFKTAEQPNFDPQDTEYCNDYGQPYPYTIVYKTISNKISQEGLDNLMYEVASIAELDPKFNQMLFYTEIDNKEDTFWNTMFGKTYQYHELIRVLRYLRIYIENATVFVCANRVDRYLSQYSLTDDDIDPNRYVSQYGLTSNDIRVKKSLNIFPGVSRRDAEIIVREGISYPIKRFFESQEQKLVCNEWFIYFSDTAFGCIKNRLMQLSGTCYLNAILNGIILCPTARNIALQIMRKVDITKYVKPLSLDVCGKKEPTYLFQLLYNTICAKVPLQKTAYNQDIIVEFSKLYSIDPEGGQGGHSMETMNRLLDLIDPNHIMLGYRSQHKELSGELIGTHRFPTLTSSELFAIRDGTGDFLIVERGGRIEDTIIHNGENFLLQFSIIRITSEMNAPKDTLTHAVVGIKCDGNYIVFDSNDGLLNIDWRKVGIKQGETRRLTEYMKQTYDIINITKIQTVPLYIRESAVARYNSMSPEELCDGLI